MNQLSHASDKSQVSKVEPSTKPTEFSEFPKQLQRLIKAGDINGQTHRWVFACAINILRHTDFTEDRIEPLLEQQSRQRDLKPNEVENAIRNAEQELGREAGGIPKAPSWPRIQPDRILKAEKSGPDLVTLTSLSPIKLDPKNRHTDEILKVLFPGDPLLCAGNAADKVQLLRQCNIDTDLSTQSFIVPSPMKGIRGLTKDGRKSKRCESNVDYRKFLVVEFDPPPFDSLPSIKQLHYKTESNFRIAMKDSHAARIYDLCKVAPLALVLD
ncbi:MAG TPA: hypothetical protein EYQ81_05510, partial [Sneathiellales bacterium]|nr:hypothetical protein [Sneathiellales bacterium]